MTHGVLLIILVLYAPGTMLESYYCIVTLEVPISARKCGYPGDVLNGWREGHNYTYHSRVTYHCHQGYELLGSPYRVCSASGEWSGSIPICQRK